MSTEDHHEESESFFLKIHNQISSSKDISQAKDLIRNHPKVLSYKILDWGGSIVLHTAVSRQPENYELIKLLVEEGLKQSEKDHSTIANNITTTTTNTTTNTATNQQRTRHSFSKEQKGGLLFCDSYNQTPLSILVAHNAIQTMRLLLKNDPPLFAPSDVVQCRLFDHVHSTYHVDMVRFLIQLYPQSILNCIPSTDRINNDSNDINHCDVLLIYHLCGKIRDSRLLIRVLFILIEEGIRKNIGGNNEYGLGGLFVMHDHHHQQQQQSDLCSAADLLREKCHQSWDVLYPVIASAIGSSTDSITALNNHHNHNNTNDVPLLHGAIMARNFRRIDDICENVQGAAFVRDSKGRLPVHIAAQQGLRWDSDRMDVIVRANVDALKENDPLTRLPLCALAAAGKNHSLTSIYKLIVLNLDEFS